MITNHKQAQIQKQQLYVKELRTFLIIFGSKCASFRPLGANALAIAIN